MLVRSVYRQLAILVAMFLAGAAIFSYYEHLHPVDALLASVSTITTIGLYVPNGGNFSTLNESEAVLLIVLIIVSVGAAASLLQGTVSSVVNGDLARGAAERSLIRRMKGHVIVFGYSHLGRYVAEKLGELGMDCVVVTRDPAIYETLTKQKTLAVLERENRPIATLREANVETAATLVTAHEKDPDNMLAIMSARRLRPDIRIISVVHDEELAETAKTAGADVVIPSSVSVGHLLALSATTKDLVGIVFSEKVGTREIAQFSVFRASKLIGKRLPELTVYAHVIGLVRNNELVRDLFDPALRVQQDDTLLVFGDPAGLQGLERAAEAT
ncbi:MAG TPA: NAD(P)-binding protein [Thermoplasmata archaeon]|nr:NAD(P)-binding protein [Thermoplasmata archaeon]